MIRLFENASHAQAYVKLRPTAPQKLADMAFEYLKIHNPVSQSGCYSLMVDVGCGSGQSVVPFALYFEKIVGIDLSKMQIEMAKKNNTFPNISFEVGAAENLGSFENVDLIASGQAVHWMEIGKFFTECYRALKPNGCLLAYGYDIPKLYPSDVPDRAVLQQRMLAAGELMSIFYKKCLKHVRISHLDERYETIFQSLNTSHKTKLDMVKENTCSLSDFLGYLRTWSCYREYMEVNNNRPDIVAEFGDNLKQKWKLKDTDFNEVKLLVTWDVFGFISERPYREQSRALAIQ